MRAKLAIAAVLVVLATAGVYWYSERGTNLSETDSILIGDFTNSAGDPVFEGTLREALAVSLAQSPSLNLVSMGKTNQDLRSLAPPVPLHIPTQPPPKLRPL